MNLLAIFIISFVVALSGALVPGPLLTAVIYKSPQHGVKTGPLIILGHAILEIIMVAVIVLGFSRFVANDTVLKIISFCGAVILLYFGIKMFCSLPGVSLDYTGRQTRSGNLAVTGMVLSLANPYWTIWWLTIGLGLVLGAKKAGMAGITAFFTGHILADLGWYSLVAFVISKGRHFISLKVYKWIIALCAVMLIGFGVWLGITSLLAKK